MSGLTCSMGEAPSLRISSSLRYFIQRASGSHTCQNQVLQKDFVTPPSQRRHQRHKPADGEDNVIHDKNSCDHVTAKFTSPSKKIKIPNHHGDAQYARQQPVLRAAKVSPDLKSGQFAFTAKARANPDCFLQKEINEVHGVMECPPPGAPAASSFVRPAAICASSC